MDNKNLIAENRTLKATVAELEGVVEGRTETVKRLQRERDKAVEKLEQALAEIKALRAEHNRWIGESITATDRMKDAHAHMLRKRQEASDAIITDLREQLARR